MWALTHRGCVVCGVVCAGEYMGGAVEADTEETKNSSSDDEEEDDDEEDDDDDDEDDDDDDEDDDEEDEDEEDEEEEDDDEEEDEGEELATEDDDDDPDSEWRSIHSTRTIPFEDIEFAEPIGYGAFGAVNRAIWRGANVAVKKVKTSLCTTAPLLPHARANFSLIFFCS